jgi:uncharacterized delta-60 repeat protein
VTRRLVLAIALLVLVAAAPGVAGGQTNWLDPALGGKPVVVDLGPGKDTAAALVVQPDGRTIVVGTSNSAQEGDGNSDMAVLRFGRDGALDPTFGAGGKVFLDNMHGVEEGKAVALQADGKIVVAGTARVWNGAQELPQMAVARLDQNGRLDPAFNGGKLMILRHEMAMSSASAVTLQPDGKIVAAGSANVLYDVGRHLSDVAVLRLTTVGSPDLSFGDAGLATSGSGYDQDDSARFVAVRPDGRIVTAGTMSTSSFSGPPPTYQLLAQYTSTGVPDAAFGRDGIAINPGGNTLQAVLRPDGTVVTAGAADVTRTGRWLTRSMAVTAYRVDGSLDTRFGVGGKTVTDAPPSFRDGTGFAGGASAGESIALDARGRLVVAGTAYGFGNGDAAAVRYNSAGGLDSAFGRAGWMMTDVASGDEQFTAVGLLPGGGIFAAGTTVHGDSQDIIFAIYPSRDRAATADGWGWNQLAQVGDGTTVDRPAAVLVAGPAGAASVAGGALHSLSLGDNGTVSAWGWNGFGQVGDGTAENRPRPVPVAGLTDVASIAAGYYHSLAVVGGTVKAWGWNTLGQLGDGTTLDRHSPVPVAGLTGVVAVSAGALHSLALRDDGTVWAWGWNGVGQLGDGTVTDRRQPVLVPGLTNIVAIAAGAYHSLALSSDGIVWAWGWNALGQLGNGSTVDRHVPVEDLNRGVVSIAAGGAHSLALNSEGAVWGWGYNGYGQVGDGSVVTRLSPVRLSGLPESNSIAGGLFHSMAITTQARVESWGWNGAGQLGDGTLTDRHAPVPVGLPSEAIAAGAYHSLATGG